MDQAALAEGHLARGSLQRHRVQRAHALGVGAVRRADMEQSIVACQVDEAVIAAKQMLDAAQDLVEYGLGVGDRAADDPEDVRRRFLLFQRLPGLVEQPPFWIHVVSLNSRTFSIAITDCAANICSSRTCGSSNEPGARRVTVMMPTALPSFMSGANSMLRYPRARAMSRAAGSSSVSTSSAGAPLRPAGRAGTGQAASGTRIAAPHRPRGPSE